MSYVPGGRTSGLSGGPGTRVPGFEPGGFAPRNTAVVKPHLQPSASHLGLLSSASTCAKFNHVSQNPRENRAGRGETHPEKGTPGTEQPFLAGGIPVPLPREAHPPDAGISPCRQPWQPIHKDKLAEILSWQKVLTSQEGLWRTLGGSRAGSTRL